jgi:hypothetical protein
MICGLITGFAVVGCNSTGVVVVVVVSGVTEVVGSARYGLRRE